MSAGNLPRLEERTCLTRTLKLLQRRGLVETRRDDAKTCIWGIVLTEAGYALLDDAAPRWNSANKAFASMLDAIVAVPQPIRGSPERWRGRHSATSCGQGRRAGCGAEKPKRGFGGWR
jgi:hypothetical protein